jgi:putative Mn2+ efflux pump MntP
VEMLSVEILLLGLALALDAAIVSFALSLLHERDTLILKAKNGFLTAFTFGAFQTGMLWLGSHAGYLFTFSSWGHYFQIVVGSIFFFLSFKCFNESSKLEKISVDWGLLPIFLLAFATSIDALVSGISLGTMPQTHFAAGAVGFITFFMCALFYTLGQFLQKIPDKFLLRLAGLIFLFLGGLVFWSIWNSIFKG